MELHIVVIFSNSKNVPTLHTCVHSEPFTVASPCEHTTPRLGAHAACSHALCDPASLCSPASCVHLLLSSPRFTSSMVALQQRPLSPPGPGQVAWSWGSRPLCYLLWRTPPMSQGASGLTTLREKGTSWDPRPPVLPCLGPCRKGDREQTAFEASVCTCEQ